MAFLDVAGQVGFQEELKQENMNWCLFNEKQKNEGKDTKLRFMTRKKTELFWTHGRVQGNR